MSTSSGSQHGRRAGATAVRKHRRIARPPPINDNTNSKWVDMYGDKVITTVFAYEGGVVLVSNEPCQSGEPYLLYGLRTQGEMAEWGLINVVYFETLEANGEAEVRHLELLPCKLEKLFDCTSIHTYFL